MDKLAIDGGTPVRSSPIHYGRQCIEEDDIQKVADVLRGELITTGPKVELLEKNLCTLTGAKYAVVVSSGTAALHCACMASGIKSGDEVITTSMTFAASANCVLFCGAKPVFADINPETYNISPVSIREHITEKTKAIIPVDFTGQAVELDEIQQICKEHKLILIEDAAHAIGTKYNGKPIGSISDMTIFSFHPVKTITGGEGGAILTNNKEYYEKLLLSRSHAITRDESQMMYPTHEKWYYEQIDLGYNYRMTDFQAALISSQLTKLARFSARRHYIVEKYNAAFSQMPEVTIQKEIPESDTTRHLYILKLNPEYLNADREEIFDALFAENIRCNVHYIPVYFHPYYQKLGYKKGQCPIAEELYENILTLPLYYLMTEEDIEDVIIAIKKVIAHYRKNND